MTDLATDLCLHSIDRISFLRDAVAEAITLMDNGEPSEARAVLAAAHDETDVGKMRVWQPGEQPF